ncbi:MAG: NAD(P)H-hydrate dehydratase, partial [Paracoccus sp. (in: a-proteobacteria)]|nr:NAD(P)H-hydrate dehydratase [Paracoccus sp. (in: a-proteobacteria)]
LDGAWLAKQGGGHKFSHGAAIIIAGDVGTGGAARLSARAALRIGAGLVTICPTSGAMPEHAGTPDALMRKPVDTAEDLAALLRDDRTGALCIGPGCGIDRAAILLPTLLGSQIPAVLDADALTAYAKTPFLPLHKNCVLTPHMGEFTRLFPDLAQRLKEAAQNGPAFSKLDAVRLAARRAGAVVLLKGPDTVIADPTGLATLHSAFDIPWLATAGAGDVLAGIIAGLLARGQSAFDAARLGTALHAKVARHVGPGLIADDVPDQLPAIIKAEWT